jgi:hypothetical protein
MLRNLIESAIRLGMASVRSSFDPSSVNDPLAMQIDWTPAKGGGTNIRTHKLVAVNSTRLEFRASMGAILFYLVFLLLGIGIMIGFPLSKLSSGNFSFSMDMVMTFFFGLLFAGVGGALLYFGTAPIVFDKKRGYFWKGRKAPHEVFDKGTLKHCTKLEQIHALQLLSEHCRGNKKSYYSYELNIVLEDGKRINVVDHGNQKKLRDDAATIADFLNIPVWDAT